MGRRRRAREVALQVLYQVDVGGADPGQAFEYSGERLNSDEEASGFARELIFGTLEHLPELDALISRLSRGWQLNRMAAVDRNIIRLGLYELLYVDDVPPAVTLNEAVELAKTFGGEDSSRFVNGILGRAALEVDKK